MKKTPPQWCRSLQISLGLDQHMCGLKCFILIAYRLSSTTITGTHIHKTPTQQTVSATVSYRTTRQVSQG